MFLVVNYLIVVIFKLNVDIYNILLFALFTICFILIYYYLLFIIRVRAGTDYLVPGCDDWGGLAVNAGFVFKLVRPEL